MLYLAMVMITIDMPENLDKAVAIYNIEQGFKDKRLAIIDILKNALKPK